MSVKTYFHSWSSLSYERRFAGVVLGLAATLLLFLVMQALIKSDQSGLNEAPAGKLLEWVRLIPDRPIETDRDRPEDPPPVVKPPPPIPPRPWEPTEGGIPMEIAPPSGEIGPVEPGASNVDGDRIILLSVKPAYPARAASRGIEGFVVVEFTVTETGTVINPSVVEAEPAGIFNRAALNAIMRFKYKPRIVRGEPVAIEGVRNRFTFELEEG